MRSMECDAVRVFQAISKIISCVPISSLLCWLNLAKFDATSWKVRFLSNFRSRLLVVLVPVLSAQQQPKLFLLLNSRNWWVWESFYFVAPDWKVCWNCWCSNQIWTLSVSTRYPGESAGCWDESFTYQRPPWVSLPIAKCCHIKFRFKVHSNTRICSSSQVYHDQIQLLW